MEKIEIFISVATSIITFITLIYNLGIKKGNDRERQYYEKILQPYISKWSADKEISAIETIKGLVASEDEDIPKYISYLISKEDSEETDEKLKKVLLCDYADIYPNDFNNVGKILNNFSKIAYYILFFMALISLFLGLLCMSVFMTDIIFVGYDFIMSNGQLVDTESINFTQYRNLFVAGGLLLGVSVLSMKLTTYTNTDRYSLSKNKIESMINKKVKGYNKQGEKYFL